MFRKKVFAVLALAFLAGVSAYGAPWFSHNSRRTPKTLTVVGNYKTPRLMAETIFSLTRQPYLLITKDNRYFIVMSKDTVEIPQKKLDVYINSLNPKRLVILGDESFVTREQEAELRKINLKRIPIMRIYGKNWTRIAEELDDLLNIGNLTRNFNRNYYDMQMSDPRLSEERTAAPDAGKAERKVAADAVANGEVPVAEPVGM